MLIMHIMCTWFLEDIIMYGLHWIHTHAWLAAGACSMDIPEIQQKYSQFAQQQIHMRAAHAARERLDMAQVGSAAAHQRHQQQQQ
jgi:hypothetical protein